MMEAIKLCFLLDKVNHSQLESDVSALCVNNNLASGEDKVTFYQGGKHTGGIRFELTGLSTQV